MRSVRALLIAIFFSTALVAQAADALYTADFSKVVVGQLPADFMAIAGSFAVAEENGRRVLRLPGEPVEAFAVSFGEPVPLNAFVSCKVFGTSSGRQKPVFGLGVGGEDGYWVRVAPAKGAIELVKDNEVRASAAFAWKSGSWTVLEMQLCAADGGKNWTIRARAWLDGQPEPADWPLCYTPPDAYELDKACLHGSPISSTPIDYANISIRRIESTARSAQTPTNDNAKR